MRRMITDAIFAKIRKLFQSIWTDDSGNVEVGKNLDVNGEISYTGGHKMPMYVHLVVINDIDTEVNFYARTASSTPINSYQELFSQLTGRDMIANGTIRVENKLYTAIAVNTRGGQIGNSFIRFINSEAKIDEIPFEAVAPNATIEDYIYME